MADFQAVTVERHGLKYWARNHHYGYASEDALCPLILQELPKSALAMPIGFIAEGEGFLPVAVMGLEAGKNLFVAPDGRWLTSYTPAPYRGYPFRIAKTETGEQILCVDEASDLISDTVGQPFFSVDGSPSSSISEIIDFLSQIDAQRLTTHRVCDVLQRHDLIQPWPIKVQGENEAREVAGLFGIDEAALNALSADALFEVRNAGGLMVAYCQLLSMQHLAQLGQLAQAHLEVEIATRIQNKGEDPHVDFLSESGTFSFGE